MTSQINCIAAFIFVFLSLKGVAQSESIDSTNILSFEEFLGYVKKYHPLIKQANLKLNTGEASLLKARGGFDPKIEIDYDRKKFKEIEYFDQLNTTFKIPTWYGIEFKANFEENTGVFLNPNLTVPEGGLYSAGVSFSLAQGLLTNERMAALKKAKFFREQTKADRNLLVNNILFDASKAYFKWLQTYNEQKIFATFLTNAKQRFDATKRNVEEGEKAAIDSVEAKITLLDRKLKLEASKLKKRKAALIVSNYLWLKDTPLEMEENVEPSNPSVATLRSSLKIKEINNNTTIVSNHPKLKKLDYKIESLEVDKFLKKNKLLPKLDLQYNFLSTQYEQINTFNTANYKAAVNISFPIFLRKERGDLKLAKIKIQDANFYRISETLNIKNKIKAILVEISSLDKQNILVQAIVKDYKTLVNAEKRKFFLGESSLFLINSREKNLIDAQLKENSLMIKQLLSNARLFNELGIVHTEAIN